MREREREREVFWCFSFTTYLTFMAVRERLIGSKLYIVSWEEDQVGPERDEGTYFILQKHKQTIQDSKLDKEVSVLRFCRMKQMCCRKVGLTEAKSCQSFC
jgi:hypothetical protein